jgi:hypothetical protein
MMLITVFTAALVGCGPVKRPPESLPSVSLIERKQMDGTMMLRFRFTDMDRVNWKGKELKAQLAKAGKKPGSSGSSFQNPGSEFTIEVGIGKVTEGDGVIFVPAWGNSRDGRIIESQPLEFVADDGTANRVTITGTGGQRLTQILETCTGPGRSVPFNPDTGIDLVTIGFAPNAYAVRVWAETVATEKAE